MKLSEQYQIKRLDRNNLVIQIRVKSKRAPIKWKTISYCGNSPFSLASSLLRHATGNHTPKDANLCEQVEMLRLELVSIMPEIEKMIKEAEL